MNLCEREELSNASVRTSGDVGGLTRQCISNPERSLAETEKQKLLLSISRVLEITTGIYPSDLEKTRRFAFGLLDRGRFLFTFQDGEKLVGFISMHLLNDGQKFIRINGLPVLHLGSGHIIPKYQGCGLWRPAVTEFLVGLKPEIRPKYVGGFTQSPKFLCLFTKLLKGQVYPNCYQQNISDDLVIAHKEVLSVVLGGFDHAKQKNSLVVCGIGEPVYSSRVYSHDPAINDFFYQELDIIPEKGDYLYFFGLFTE